jgi:hypothetical protein
MNRFILPDIRPRRARMLIPLIIASLIAISAWAAPATVKTLTGGDPGEGLDLQGNFTYAVNVGPSGAAGKAGDADFTGDNVPGVTVSASQQIATGGWGAVNYGATDADRTISTVMNSIRWTPSPGVVTVTLAVEAGVEYKLQILEHEECCPGRGFNIIIDGITEVTNLIPGFLQQGDTYPSNPDFFSDSALHLETRNRIGVVVTKQFVAQTNTIEFICDGPAADDERISDRNAILAGFTLERLTASNDTDRDGLPDDWEMRFFNNLTQTPAGDPDNDGVTNQQEFARSLSPSNRDTDGDGLADGAEITTHNTDPTKTDSDGDFLADGDEVNRYGTNPAKKDTDDDTVSDFDEARLMTDPKSAQSKPQKTTVGLFTGADAGEGLDLQGTFVYAIDHATAAVGGQVGDALFTDESVAGATVQSGNKTGLWNADIKYGDSPSDDTLEEIMNSISWSDAIRVTVPPHETPLSDVRINLTNLTVGASYKLQLLFAEQQWPRGFDVHIDGAHVADDFSPAFYQGGGFPLVLPSPDDRGVVLTHNFVARGKNLSIILDGRTVTIPQFTDHNAIINALTLERVAAPADTDNDTLPDAWETEYFGNLTQTAAADADGDTIPNSTEFADGTNPSKADSDNDALSDSQEKTAGSNPRAPDSDHDGLTDGSEVTIHNSSPIKVDSDSDGWSDSDEINIRKTNPNKSETGATVFAFRGGDAGEGLDLDGKFLYAFAIGNETGAGQVRDAVFTGETVDGVLREQAPSVATGWYNPDYGDTPNDDALELAINSIRHSGGGIKLTLSNLVAGAAYKLQLLFGEQCCNRGMDVFVGGRLIADEFAPYVVHGGRNHSRLSAAISYTFIASTNRVVVQTTGSSVTTPAYTDRNPIMNAVTLEEVGALADTDNDGLSDPWEVFYLGNLSQSATADGDNDGLNNLGELQAGTDPTVADGDGDGLNDGGERAAGANPNNPDTDGDGLSDGLEVNTHHSDPTKADADNDGLPDPTEIQLGSNPNVADNPGVSVGVFSGGDAGEGLDLEGTFVYAVDIVTPSGQAPGQIRDAVFTEENAPGVTVVAQNNLNPGQWGASEYGDTPNDDLLEVIMQSIHWSAAPASPSVALANLTPGKRYKLQLLFYENCCNRGFDILVEDKLIADEFAPYVIHGGIGNVARGAVVTYEFTAQDNTLNILLRGATVTTPAFNDHNAILNALTLEDLGTAPVLPKITAINLQGGVSLTFDSVSGRSYTLEYKAKLSDASWTQVGNVAATGASTSIRDDVAAHRTGATGFWRLRTQ